MALVLGWLFVLSLLFLPLSLHSQDRLKTYPNYDRYERLSKEIREAVKSGALRVTWKDNGEALEFARDGKQWRFDLRTKKLTEIGKAADQPPMPFGRRAGFPERGRQFTQAESPDKKFKAVYRDRNLYLEDQATKAEIAITADGSDKTRVKYGTASWVYGEELDQITAMWWSPDSRKLAFYRFDEKNVPDYFLQLDQTKLYSKVDIEPYPKAGEPNPVVDLLVYDLATRKITTVDVRSGQPFSNEVVGHYVYGVDWTKDGREILFFRANRRQNITELVAANPDTGQTRVVVREEWPASWTENSPQIIWLKDGRRFILVSERTGFRNLYLYDLSGKLLATLTRHPFDVVSLTAVDEKAGLVYYTARSGDNHMKVQLHRVSLTGKNDRRLTDPAFNHNVDISPNFKYFIDVAQTHQVAPFTRLYSTSGVLIKELAQSDLSKFEALGLKKAELFTFKSADGQTELHGLLQFPSNFDPNKKYPLLVSVYAGPATNGARETFVTPNPITEFGFLVASLDSRSAAGRGKKFLDAIYQKLGVVEIDDQAAGVRALSQRPYVDGSRVGIFGTSYGGYASIMALLRHPDVFAAACASSPVTAWEHYDSIYTERYMWIPQENKEGYRNGSALTYVNNLKGRLMIYYGTADNNVHPNNTMQLIQALQKANRSFEVQVGPDMGHTSVRLDRMMEFFIENLVLNR
ncbi:MAG: Dipeptidyl peptidase IV [Candidatus Saccharicenans subterraneus]|uniref:Dipeptidyl peptidase IV n=1 Tax=Candidatus Saccharicenans subterraneus TaxID=2508984 RepID=A0A3E2BPJ9_9BACT|nr:MAG: Dipeptidyl peptidase IV [Candidatus Saccharicenans subterraneum]